MKSLVRILFTLLLLNLPFYAQQVTPQVSTWSFNSSAIVLPGNHATIAGTDAGIAVTITPNFDLQDTNFLASGNAFQYFGGGFNYRLAALSNKLNNISPNLNGLRFQFFVTASAGVDRINPAAGDSMQHYAFTAGGGVNYMLTANGTWQMGARVQYAKFPGYNNNTAIVELGPSLHF